MKVFKSTIANLRVLKTLSAVTLTLSIGLLLPACERGWDPSDNDSSSSSSSDNNNEKTYRGPGSNWELVVNESISTFTFNKSNTPNSTPTLVVNGDYEKTSAGFIRLTVVKSTPGQGVGTNQQITGINIADNLNIFIPFDGSVDQPLMLARANGCPTNISSNWLLYKPANSKNAEVHTEGHFGQLSYNKVNGETVVVIQYSMDNTEQELDGISLGTGTCTESLSTSETLQSWFSANETTSIEVATNSDALESGDSSDSQFLLSVQKRSISASSIFDADYIGILYNSSYNSRPRSIPVKGGCAAGKCTLYTVTDISNGDTENAAHILDLSSENDDNNNKPLDGFVVGGLTAPGTESPLGKTTCSINDDYRDSGTKFIACVGIAPSASDSSQLTNLFLVSTGQSDP
ncbi:hypothetical protein [Teredinibacter franksiae]|uniref:hypothetical protein n=1 Tax=Teredinibacter franksiae TaxID=2761453 RepID=UPI001626ED14|nr:hypothetical protein [Teredinibacter franksiae]